MVISSVRDHKNLGISFMSKTCKFSLDFQTKRKVIDTVTIEIKSDLKFKSMKSH